MQQRRPRISRRRLLAMWWCAGLTFVCGLTAGILGLIAGHAAGWLSLGSSLLVLVGAAQVYRETSRHDSD